ncbi:peptide transporter family 1-like isoform X2 [Chironomus tepperi]|uniref:peptide transporter family 1-like isoform X2 n=1 Tax=Chironomus tepperi TaxID=113505 RepID=UPI00391F26A5
MEESADAVTEKKRRFPKSIPFILILSLLERVSSIGSSSILLLYMYQKLHFDESTSTALFHTNDFLIYFSPIVGAIVAESYFGIFKTLVAGTLLFLTGISIVAVGSIGVLNLPAIPLTIFGLFISIFGVGCLRGNLSAFGGNQFKLPEDSKNLQLFFSVQFMFFNGGALLSRIFSPILRQDVKCFGSDDCYPVAFGMTLVTMSLGFLTIYAGKRHYVHRPVTDNVFMKVCGCVLYSLRMKLLRMSKEQKSHWLDYADTKYDQKLIEDTKKLFRILKVFIPIPIFWSVFMQQNSRWVFQAARMDGDIGFYTIKPDQMIAVNPISSILLSPFCSKYLYPFLIRIKIGGMFARINIGKFLCFIAFCIAIYVETVIQEHRISVLWLVPQWIILALSENILYVALMNFAYSEGPVNMKAVLTGCVYTTMAIGNLLVTLISGAKLFSSQVYEFMFFNVMLLIAMGVFSLLANDFKKSQKKIPETVL